MCGHEDNEAHPFAYAMARERCECGELPTGFQLLLASLRLDLAAALSLAWLMPGIARMHVTIDLRLIRLLNIEIDCATNVTNVFAVSCAEVIPGGDDEDDC